MVRAGATILVVSLAMAGGCEQKNPYEKQPMGAPEPGKMIGQDPTTFDCKTVITVAEVEGIVGMALDTYDETVTPEPGTPKACSYSEKGPNRGDAMLQTWRIAFDCRPKAHYDAENYMKMYLEDPEASARLVEVGKRGVDHGNIRIIALDNDTPCAIYVVGVNPDARVALSKAVLAKLNEANQPTPIRAVKK